MPQVSVQQLFNDTHDKVNLTWIAGEAGGGKPLTSETVQKPSLALIGHLNFVHPNRVQVLGCAEMDYLHKLEPTGLTQAINNLFSTELAAVIVANGEEVPPLLVELSNLTQTPLFASPQPSPQIMSVLGHYLTQSLAEFTTLHGVFMDVMSMGVLLTGDSAIGKSELALELVTRGHRLVADDIVELYQITPDTLEGRCPQLLQNFLEVRGLGVLNIRELFGETAVKQQKYLRLIVRLEKMSRLDVGEIGRLEMSATTKNVLGVSIPEVRIPVAAGRNLAVLVEVAVRNHILQLRGISSSDQFIQRHAHHMAETSGTQ